MEISFRSDKAFICRLDNKTYNSQLGESLENTFIVPLKLFV